MVRKEWEKKVPLEIVDVFNECGGKTSSKTLSELRKSGVGKLTPLTHIRSIAKGYSRKYKIPITVSEEAFKDNPWADGLHRYTKGKSKIYLHPILQYYPEKYVRGVIEHELDHAKVEEKWEEVL